jgi:hypothetical protein
MKNLLNSLLLICIIFIIPSIGLYAAMSNTPNPFLYLISLGISVTLWFSLRKKLDWKIDEQTRKNHSW